MAVRHGYGKIAGTDALVFAYDTGDTRNSYRGEPTENLFPYPQFTNYTNNVVGAASITKKDFGDGKIGIEIIQGSTSDIISFSMHSLSSAVSGATYTWSSYVNCTSTGNKVKAQVAIRVDGVRYWLTNSNTWTTSITECSHLFAPTVANQWHRVDNQFTMPTGTLTDFQLGGWYRNTSNYTLKLANAQLEIKSHPTPFVNGTRSATQGLLDLTGNSNIDLSNVSFDSNAQKTFDGTDDYVSIVSTNTITDYSQPFTMETIFRVDTGATWDNGYRSNIFSIAGAYGGMYGLFKYNQNDVGIQLRDADSTTYAVATGLSKGVYYHLVGTSDGSGTVSLYLNGTLTQDNVGTLTGAPDTQNLFIGGSRAFGGAYGNHYQGDIPIAKYYNRALTPAEVQSNYQHYKKRFNI